MITNSGWESIPLPRTGGAPGRTVRNLERRASRCQLVCEGGTIPLGEAPIRSRRQHRGNTASSASVARLRGTHDDPRLQHVGG